MPSTRPLPYTVLLSHAPNPDLADRGGYWPDAAPPAEAESPVDVASLREASDRCRTYIETHGLGGGNWTGGAVYADGVQIARVSYNGRVWDAMTDAEIPLPPRTTEEEAAAAASARDAAARRLRGAHALMRQGEP